MTNHSYVTAVSAPPSADEVGERVGRFFSTVAGWQVCYTTENRGRYANVSS